MCWSMTSEAMSRLANFTWILEMTWSMSHGIAKSPLLLVKEWQKRENPYPAQPEP
jgi:hypothetical protein